MIDDVAKTTTPLWDICSKLLFVEFNICKGIWPDEVICMPSITFNVVVVFLTKKKSLVVYDGSHKLNNEYNELHPTDEPDDFNIINEDFTDTIKATRKLLHVEAGSLVLWDSRTFHQNDCGQPGCTEERLVQYLCYLPKDDARNTAEQHETRAEYFRTYRTTPHIPYPISAVPLQSSLYTYYKYNQVYIDYNRLLDPELDDLLYKIYPLL